MGIVMMGLLMVNADAARAAEDEEPQLGTVVVTATRTEAPLEQATTSITAITADDLAAQQATAVEDVLRDVPGVDVVRSGSPGNSTSVFIRGADADQVLVLIDGVEQNSPTLGQFNFGTLTTDNLERIEVLRGAGGMLYGSEAVGGVVNLITKRGEGRPTMSVSAAGGNEDLFQPIVSFSGAEGPVGFSGSLSYLTQAGYQPVNDDYNNLASSLRLDADVIDGGTLRGFFRSTNNKLGLANNLFFLGTLDPNARFEEDRYVGKAEWEHAPLESLRYTIGGSIVDAEETYDDPDAMDFFTRHSRIPTQILTAETQANYYAGEFGITTAGFEFQELSARPRFENVGFGGVIEHQGFNANRSNFAGYLQQQLFFFDERLSGQGGFRVDGDEEFGEEVSPGWSVGYRHDWDPDRRWSTFVRGGYQEGFKAPTFNELFFPNFGNPALDPETNSEWNGGLVQRVWGEQAIVEATYFARRTSGLIQAACNPQTFQCTAENIGRVDMSGVETIVTVRPLAELTVSGTYTYLDIDRSPATSAVLRRPRHRMATRARYRRDDLFRAGHVLDVAGTLNYVGDRKDLDPTTFGTTSNPHYTTAELAVTYSFPVAAARLQRVALFANAGNLWDEDYEEALGFPAPPVHAVAGARITF
jgi:vitamin B12 transporter